MLRKPHGDTSNDQAKPCVDRKTDPKPVDSRQIIMLKRVVLFSILAAAHCALAQSPPPTVTVKPSKVTLKVGAPITAVVQVKFAANFHGYHNPPTDKYQIPISVVAGKDTTISKIEYPKGVMKKVGSDTTASSVYEGSIEIKVTFAAPKKVGSSALNIMLNYQQCNADSCYPPDKVMASAKIKVTK